MKDEYNGDNQPAGQSLEPAGQGSANPPATDGSKPGGHNTSTGSGEGREQKAAESESADTDTGSPSSPVETPACAGPAGTESGPAPSPARCAEIETPPGNTEDTAGSPADRIGQCEPLVEKILKAIDEQASHSEEFCHDLVCRLDALHKGQANAQKQSEKLSETVKDALKRVRSLDKNAESLETWANQFILNHLPDLVAQHIDSMVTKVDEIRTGTMDHLGVIDQKIAQMEGRVNESIVALIEDRSRSATWMVESHSALLDQVGAIAQARVDAEQKLVRQLSKFWLDVQETDAGLRRGITATGTDSLKLLRRKLLRSYISLLTNVGCVVELGDEAVELRSVEFDGSKHRWHRSEGDEVARSRELATVLLPGWSISEYHEKPLLGRLGKGSVR